MTRSSDNPEHVAAIERIVFSGEPFTYGQLCDAGQWDTRLPDKLIQRHRRKGLIEYSRQGAAVVWTLTTAGRAERAKRNGCANA